MGGLAYFGAAFLFAALAIKRVDAPWYARLAWVGLALGAAFMGVHLTKPILQQYLRSSESTSDVE